MKTRIIIVSLAMAMAVIGTYFVSHAFNNSGGHQKHSIYQPKSNGKQVRNNSTIQRFLGRKKTDLHKSPEITTPAAIPKDDDERIAWLLGQKGKGSYHDRFKAVDTMTNTLSDSQIYILLSFLDEKTPSKCLTTDDWYSLKNEVMNRLRNQDKRPRDLTTVLIRLASDPNGEAGTRDYALQHLGLWYLKTPSPDEKARIENAFWSTTKQVESPFAGVALLIMYRIQQESGDIQEKQLSSLAFALASNPKALSETRTSSLALCTEMGLTSALPLATRLAVNDPSVPLRLASIHAIGELGGSSEVVLLTELSTADKIPEVRKAASVALSRLNQRKSLALYPVPAVNN